MKLPNKKSTPLVLILLVTLTIGYLGLQIWSLSWYPFVHSDEVWLASLSRSMVNSWNLGVTEDFFVLTPRHPHGIKTLFHLLQGIFVIGSWSISTVRIISLISGICSLVLFALLVHLFLGPTHVFSGLENQRVEKTVNPETHGTKTNVRVLLVFFATFAWALDPWFFLTAGFGRQESLILLFMMASLCALLSGRILLAGILTGISIFVHPNSFLIAWAVLPWLFYDPKSSIFKPQTIHSRTVRTLANDTGTATLTYPWGQVRTYALTVAGFGFMAIGLSLWLDPQFFRNYLEFGLEVGVGAPPAGRIQGFFEYLHRMVTRTAGTYWIPPFGPSFWLIGISWALHLVIHDWKSGSLSGQGFRTLGNVSLTLITVSFALILIGKYSPTATVFLLPWGYLALVILGRTKPILALVLLSGVIGYNGLSLVQDLDRWNPKTSGIEFEVNRYSRFISEVKELVGPEARVLGNLNTGFAFDQDRLRVIRDLGSLPPVEEGTRNLPVLERPLGRFIQDQNIGWLLFNQQELELIFTQRPLWNLVYGNPYRFYPDLVDLISEYGTLVGVIHSPWYGQRLVPFMDRLDSKVMVYRLDVVR
jgi:hypothetical protein